MRRIMFVDDEPQLLESLRDALRPWRRHWNITFAPDGNAALEALECELFDVVISDMRMPGMTGLELRESLVASGSDIPTVLITAYADETTGLRARKAGST